MNKVYVMTLIYGVPLLFVALYFFSNAPQPKEPEIKAQELEPIIYLAQEKDKLNQQNNEPIVSQALQSLRRLNFQEGSYHDPENSNDVLSYYMYMPKEPWPDNIKFPLIVHLSGEQSDEFGVSAVYATQNNRIFDFPAIHFVPKLPLGELWRTRENHTTDNVGLVMEAVGRIMVENPIDEKRLYAVGCGDGSYGVFSLLTRYPEFFASAIAHSGTWEITRANILAQTPLLMMTGTQNKKVPRILTSKLAQAIENKGGTVIYKEIESMPYNCKYEGFYTQKIFEWLFSNKNSLSNKQEAANK